jgi:hemerythrin superfamily protein
VVVALEQATVDARALAERHQFGQRLVGDDVRPPPAPPRPDRIVDEDGHQHVEGIRASMDATRILEADHRLVEQLFSQIEKAKGQERTQLIDELATNVRAHMELEEQVLYPAMEPVTGKEDVEEGVTEHELARKALEDLIRLAPEDPGVGAALDACKAGIEHHVEDEEGEVFPKLRKEGAQVLEQIATPFMAKRVELGMPMDPEALAASSTKDELLAEAQSADVSGAASMTKTELAEALVEKMTSS